MLENIVLKMVNNTVLFEHDAAVDVLCVIECFISQSFNFQFMMLFSKTQTHTYIYSPQGLGASEKKQYAS